MICGPARRVLSVESLDERVVPAGLIAVGFGAGAAPVVALFHSTNNDGVPDSRLSPANVGLSAELIVAPGSGGLLPAKAFKSLTNTGEIQPGDPPLTMFFPLGPGYTNGSFAAFAGNGI